LRRRRRASSATLWSASIDALSVGTDVGQSDSGIALIGQPDLTAARLFLISAGNVRERQPGVDYRDVCDNSVIEGQDAVIHLNEGVIEKVDARLAQSNSMGLADLGRRVNFTLAFAVVHEFPSAERFFAEVSEVSKPGATLLFAEPSGHVKPPEFESELQAAAQAGFTVANRPEIRRSQVALLKKA